MKFSITKIGLENLFENVFLNGFQIVNIINEEKEGWKPLKKKHIVMKAFLNKKF